MFLTVRQQLIVARAGFTYDVNNEHMQSFLRSTSFPHVHPPLPPGSNPACGQEKPRQTGGGGGREHRHTHGSRAWTGDLYASQAAALPPTTCYESAGEFVSIRARQLGI